MNCGCHATATLKQAGQKYYLIDKITDAYLIDTDTLVIKGTKNVIYKSGKQRIDSMKVGIDIGQIQKFKLKSPLYIDDIIHDVGYAPFLDENVDNIIRKEHLAVNYTLLQRPIFISSNTNANMRIPILKDENVTSLEKPFILDPRNGGYFFINKIDSSSVTIIQLQLSDRTFSEPWWTPIKFLLYGITVPADMVQLPFKLIFSRGLLSPIRRPQYGSTS